MFKMKELSTAIAMGLFIIICATCCSKKDEHSKHEVTLLEKEIGKDNLEILKSPNQVFKFSVIRSLDLPYVPMSREVALTKEEVLQWQNVLVNDKSYHFDLKKKVVFIPSVALKFIKDREVVVLLSPLAKQLKFILPGRTVTLDYDPAQEQFAALLQEKQP